MMRLSCQSATILTRRVVSVSIRPATNSNRCPRLGSALPTVVSRHCRAHSSSARYYKVQMENRGADGSTPAAGFPARSAAGEGIAAFRDRVQLHTLVLLTGDAARGKRVVDVACGTGRLARALRSHAGAAHVVASDPCPETISLAEEEEEYPRDKSLGSMAYEVEDVGAGAARASFDVVASGWLLAHAVDRDELLSMCRGLAAKARSGGRLVTLVLNPDLFRRTDPAFLRPLGFEFTYPRVVEEGAAIRTKTFTPSGLTSVETENYYYAKETYIDQLEAAGFRDVQLHQPKISPHPSGLDDSEYWKQFFDCPLFLAITAIKN